MLLLALLLVLVLAVFVRMVKLSVFDFVSSCIDGILVLFHGVGVRAKASVDGRVECSTKGFTCTLELDMLAIDDLACAFGKKTCMNSSGSLL